MGSLFALAMKVHGALQTALPVLVVLFFAAFLPLQAQGEPQYDENLAVAFLNAAAAVYPENDTLTETCLNKAFSKNGSDDFEVLSSVKGNCGKNPGDVCKSYIAVSHTHKVFIIAIRGTEGLTQFWDETKSGLSAAAPATYVSNNPDVKAVGYFLTALPPLYEGLNIVDNLRNQNLNGQDASAYNVYVTGHSLGGAMAALMSKRIVFKGVRVRDQVKLITFGEPRVGNYAFAQEIKQDVPYSFRVVHGDDPIPHLPPCGSHADILFTTCRHDGWYHHSTEVWYTARHKAMNTGSQNYKVCRSSDGEDTSCSDGINALSRFFGDLGDHGTDMHLNYFNHFISGYGKHGCVDVKGTASASVSVFLFLAAVLMVLTR